MVSMRKQYGVSMQSFKGNPPPIEQTNATDATIPGQI
jgi:hypothetical protein